MTLKEKKAYDTDHHTHIEETFKNTRAKDILDDANESGLYLGLNIKDKSVLLKTKEQK